MVVMETTLSEDQFLMLYGEKADNDDDIYPDPDTIIEYGDTAQLDKSVGHMMEDNLSDMDTDSNLLFLFLGGILLMFLLLLIMTVCVTLVMKDTRQDLRQKKHHSGDNNVRDKII
jgi:hypothetical protein